MMINAAYQTALEMVDKGCFVFFPPKPVPSVFFWTPLHNREVPLLWNGNPALRVVAVVSAAKVIAEAAGVAS